MTIHLDRLDPPSARSESGQPKPEYPRPQFARDRWLNLNGTWGFEIDQGDSGIHRGLRDRELAGVITVPFCPESAASGVANTDFLEAVWYRREVAIPPEWEGDVLLHFGAVDHDATVWVNGTEVARHRGGFTSFTANLHGVAAPGETAVIVVRARDPRDALQARGKQATAFANSDCLYTRTTGIWQTVWMEPVPPVHLERPHVVADLAGRAFTVTLPLSANRRGYRVSVRLLDDDGVVDAADVAADVDLAPSVRLRVPGDRLRVWRPGDGQLYGLRIELTDDDGEVVDAAWSYAGMRSVSIDGQALRLNGRPFFQRLVLDQGYWPDTLMTAPSDAAAIRDIELALAAGFNGARLHQKVFEERFFLHADRLGYPVWAEFGDWGVSGAGPAGHNQQPTASFVAEWVEAVERDRNHPSIVGWCPMNETHQDLVDEITVLDDVMRGMFLATKAADPTRPVIDSSGYSHRVRETDVWDAHLYEQDPQVFADHVSGLTFSHPYANWREPNPTAPKGAEFSYPYAGQPYFLSEYGGIWWNPDVARASGAGGGSGADGAFAPGGGASGAGLRAEDERESSWGYGERVGSEEEFHERFTALTMALTSEPLLFGYCYTQLTDVFQEQNGIYRFDRSEKLDVSRVRAAQSAPAAYEQE